jgi:hypothetical protein
MPNISRYARPNPLKQSPPPVTPTEGGVQQIMGKKAQPNWLSVLFGDLNRLNKAGETSLGGGEAPTAAAKPQSGLGGGALTAAASERKRTSTSQLSGPARQLPIVPQGVTEKPALGVPGTLKPSILAPTGLKPGFLTGLSRKAAVFQPLQATIDSINAKLAMMVPGPADMPLPGPADIQPKPSSADAADEQPSARPGGGPWLTEDKNTMPVGAPGASSDMAAEMMASDVPPGTSDIVYQDPQTPTTAMPGLPDPPMATVLRYYKSGFERYRRRGSEDDEMVRQRPGIDLATRRPDTANRL